MAKHQLIENNNKNSCDFAISLTRGGSAYLVNTNNNKIPPMPVKTDSIAKEARLFPLLREDITNKIPIAIKS